VSAGLRVREHDGGRGHRPAARLRGGVVVTTIGVTAGQVTVAVHQYRC
jgi:hypothetical protein